MKYLKYIILFIIIFGAFVAYKVYDRNLDTRQKKALFDLSQISKALEKAKEVCGEYPKTLEQLRSEEDNCFSKLNLKFPNRKDPWGNQYIYFSNGVRYSLSTEHPNSIIVNEFGALFFPSR